MARAQQLGLARCPHCKRTPMRVALSKSGLACSTCERCQMQCFARSAESDEFLRDCIDAGVKFKDDTGQAPALPTPTPAPAPALPAPTPAPAPAPAGMGWGILGRS